MTALQAHTRLKPLLGNYVLIAGQLYESMDTVAIAYEIGRRRKHSWRAQSPVPFDGIASERIVGTSRALRLLEEVHLARS